MVALAGIVGFLLLCREGFLVKLNMLVRSFPNCLARERLLCAADLLCAAADVAVVLIIYSLPASFELPA